MDEEKTSARKTLILFVISVLVITGALGYAVATSVDSGDAFEYFKHVDEVAAAPGEWANRPVRLHGNVVTGTIEKKRASLDYRFAVFRHGQWLDVTYSGLVPDTFKDCSEVVVKGRLAGSGKLFRAETVTAKCPSKYEAEQREKGCGPELTEVVVATRAGQSRSSDKTVTAN